MSGEHTLQRWCNAGI